MKDRFQGPAGRPLSEEKKPGRHQVCIWSDFEVSDPVSKKKLAAPVKWEQAETISAWIDAVRKEVKQ